jgi:hypothetical protein
VNLLVHMDARGTRSVYPHLGKKATYLLRVENAPHQRTIVVLTISSVDDVGVVIMCGRARLEHVRAHLSGKENLNTYLQLAEDATKAMFACRRERVPVLFATAL